MSPQTAPDFVEDQITSGALRLRKKEYAELDFANSVAVPEELRPVDASALRRAEGRVERSAERLIRLAYHCAIVLLLAAVAVGTLTSKPLLAFSVGFLALSVCGFANYITVRLWRTAWMPIGVASRLTIGSFFLALTALFVARFN
jgi:hypothetical protein